MRKKFILAVACSMALMITACGQEENVESGVQVESITTENENTNETENSVETNDVTEPATEDVTETTDNEALRTVAEGFIGKNATDLVDAIGDFQSIHPAGDKNDNDKFVGYLHYADFEVEFESGTEDYLLNADLTGCTVTAIVDSMFDN